VLWPGSTQHFYYEPFRREDRLVRLLTQVPGTGLDTLREKSAGTTNLNFVRYKELWGDQGTDDDILTIDGTNVLTPPIAPRAKRLNALFVFDRGLDGVTDLTAPIPRSRACPSSRAPMWTSRRPAHRKAPCTSWSCHAGAVGPKC